MLFSSIEFLFYFLPVTLLVYFIIPMPGGSPKLRNYWLLLTSLIFYGWVGVGYAVLITAQSLAGWLFGLLIENRRGKPGAKLALLCAVLVGLSGLIYFKYTNFFLANINALFGTDISPIKFILVIGISFKTFQILSYNIDLYYGKIKSQRNFFTFFTYVAFFAQLTAGPIIRYSAVEKEFAERKHSIESVSAGMRRFALGLAKKVLIADVLGGFVAFYKSSGDKSTLGAWLYLFVYAFYLYFDFSGYSDMALGLGKIFGFKFPENFNYPYIAKSVTDFWRRWHISMSMWFRDYIYIPLGGNRVSKWRHILNILAVWLATGFWHGAGWNFMAWGVYFGLLLLFEKFIFGKLLGKLPSVIAHLYLILCIAVGWTLFDSDTVGIAVTRIGYMFGAGAEQIINADMLYYLRSYLIPLIIAIIGCTPIPSVIAAKIINNPNPKIKSVMTVLEPVAVGVLIILCAAYLVDGSFFPNIYYGF